MLSVVFDDVLYIVVEAVICFNAMREGSCNRRVKICNEDRRPSLGKGMRRDRNFYRDILLPPKKSHVLRNGM